MTQIGPFPDVGLLTAGLQELSKHLANSVVEISFHVERDDSAVRSAKRTYFAALDRWCDIYMPRKVTADDTE